jgi:hypothetical protein
VTLFVESRLTFPPRFSSFSSNYHHHRNPHYLLSSINLRLGTESQKKNIDRQRPFLMELRRSCLSHWAPLDLISPNALTLSGIDGPTHVGSTATIPTKQPCSLSEIAISSDGSKVIDEYVKLFGCWTELIGFYEAHRIQFLTTLVVPPSL